MEKKIFIDFLLEGIEAEERQRYGPAVSNYYKALVFLCSYIIERKLRKTPTNHNEIFLFLRVSFPEIHEVVDKVFSIYRDSYNVLMTKDDCEKIKNALKKVAQLGNIETEFTETLKRI